MSFPNLEGQKIPSVTLKTRVDGEWRDLDTAQFFAGRKVVVFSLPGAFTPTCSSTHVPRYEELFDEFKKAGVDAIACVSVNDAFVMDEWRLDQNVHKINFLPDGNGDLTRALGMLVDKRDLGFGERSWRYSMLVEDGEIKKSFIEPDKPGDPFEVSDADTMLDFIAPGATKPRAVTIFTRPFCPFCHRAKKFLTDRKIPFFEITVGRDLPAAGLRSITGENMVPQVFVEGERLRGNDEVEKYFA